MTLYIKNTNTFRVASEDEIEITHTLPAANYLVRIDVYKQYYLEHIEDFKSPTKLYGDTEKKADRIINTYKEREVSTGVLLTGDKGSGKTLLTKTISTKLKAEGIPTIVVNSPFADDGFIKFIQSIEQSCIITFDEFEKVYPKEEQEHILSLLDGLFSSKKLFILTVNDEYRVNPYMKNRPGRLYYNIKYKGLSKEFIEEYCNDNLNDKSQSLQVCNVSSVFESFNFDILKALVEEMNRYGETAQAALEMLNAEPENNRDNRFNVRLFINGVEIEEDLMNDNGVWSGNILRPNGITLEYHDEEADKWVNSRFESDELVSLKSEIEEFTFKNKSGDIAIFTKKRSNPFNFANTMIF